MTERQRQRLWKKTQAKRDRFTRAFTREWKSALVEQIQPVLKEIDASTVNSIEDRVERLIREDALEGIYERTVKVVGAYFAQEIYKMMAKVKGDDWIRKNEIPTNAQFQERVWTQLYAKAGERITAITGESKRQAVGVIQGTLAQINMETRPPGASETAQLLRDRLRDDWGDISTYRAARIARTEVAAASNLGSITGARETKEPMMKVWLSTRDSRTRRRRGRGTYDHYGTFPNGPDGEKVEMEEKFQKTGEPLDYPCDYSGDGANVIHCRCSVYYEPKVVDEAPDTPTPRPEQPPEPPPPPPGRTRPGSRAARIKAAQKKAREIEKSKAFKKMRESQIKEGELVDKMNKLADEANEVTRRHNRRIRSGQGYDEGLAQTRRALISQWEETNKAYKRAQYDTWDAQNDILEEFADIMDLGKGSNVDYSVGSKNLGAVRKRSTQLFERIVGQVSDAGQVNISATVYKKRGRASCGGNHIKLFGDSGPATVCHEAGHAVEHNSAVLHQSTKDFLKRRIKWGERTVSYHGEGCWEDKFINPYTGRYYQSGWGGTSINQMFEGASIRQGSTEVFSMWWTHFIENPGYFIQTDPDYFNWGLETIFKLQNLE